MDCMFQEDIFANFYHGNQWDSSVLSGMRQDEDHHNNKIPQDMQNIPRDQLCYLKKQQNKYENSD